MLSDKQFTEICTNLCKCKVCLLADHVIMFIDTLIGPKEEEELIKEAQDDTKNDNWSPTKRELVGTLLSAALAEFTYRGSVNPEVAKNVFDAFYFEKAKLLGDLVVNRPDIMEYISTKKRIIDEEEDVEDEE